MLGGLFNLFKSKSAQSTQLMHTIDVHSHLIPAIDDGSQSLTQSIEIIEYLHNLGFKKLITTPHIMSHRFANTQQNILKGYEVLKAELIKREIDILLEVGAEYYYDEHFLDLIDKNEIMTFSDNYMLFELSYHNKPFGLEQTVHKLLESGYKPILAHPERYTYYNTKEHYHQLKDMGLMFQINAISTQGFYGKNVQKSVENIIDLGLVDFIGSDIHAMKYADSFATALRHKIYLKIMQNNPIKNDYL
ncbi:MAG: CpsB/CapC family capsule biosynthesis tyrosine phosphatase [Campylobacterota bacterium]|nr:CpsB/CapC family capsule biosynthesis tyrosine phosphatase [Campylobacterota bacterium]